MPGNAAKFTLYCISYHTVQHLSRVVWLDIPSRFSWYSANYHSVRHFGIRHFGIRHSGIRHFGIRHSGNDSLDHPGPQCKGAPKQFRTCSNKIRSSVTFKSSFCKGLVLLYFRPKSACSFALHFMLLMQIMHNYLAWLLRRLLARTPYVVLSDLKPLIEDGNLQVYMYCVHARKRASGPPRTHYRACKISKFPGGEPPGPLAQSILWDPTFCICPGPPQSSRRSWDYLLIIEVIISTEPDHHTEAEPLVHFVVHAITVHGGIRGAVLH